MRVSPSISKHLVEHGKLVLSHNFTGDPFISPISNMSVLHIAFLGRTISSLCFGGGAQGGGSSLSNFISW